MHHLVTGRRLATVAVSSALTLSVFGGSAWAAPNGNGNGTDKHQASSDPSLLAPQPASNADFSGNGANVHGVYDSTRNGDPSLNGKGDPTTSNKPCAGCVGKADNKNPKGQQPGGSDHNAGYECDRNQGIGKGNPAHTGCTTPTSVTPPPVVPPVTPPVDDNPCAKGMPVDSNGKACDSDKPVTPPVDDNPCAKGMPVDSNGKSCDSDKPATPPVTTPVTTPVNTPVTTPVSTPVRTPATSGSPEVGKPVSTPVSTPVTEVLGEKVTAGGVDSPAATETDTTSSPVTTQVLGERITRTPSATAVAPAAAAVTSLPFTGGHTDVMVLFAALFLAAGATLLYGGRRRTA